MVGIILYLISCSVIAAVLTFLYVMMRPVSSRDELKSWRVLAVFMVLTLVAPYGYAEILTRLVGGHMEAVVNTALKDANLDDNVLEYYRVISYNGHRARVVAVAKGKSDVG